MNYRDCKWGNILFVSDQNSNIFLQMHNNVGNSDLENIACLIFSRIYLFSIFQDKATQTLFVDLEGI